ncbi:MAG: hypothetical protein AB7F86_01470 [Bdellovibrionales bacterium]
MMDSQRGSITVIVLVSLATIAAFISATQYFIDRIRVTAERERSKYERESLTTTIPMVFPSKTDCLANILNSPPVPGKSRLSEELKKMALNPNAKSNDDIAILYPGTNKIFLEKSGKYNNTEIAGVSVDQMKSIDPATRSFLATVKIDFSTKYGAARSVVVMPMYIGTDPTGQPDMCYFSTFLNENMTVEDSLCKALKGPDYKFDPVGDLCKVI